MYQQITLIGNLGNEPEMRYTAGGTAVASFTLAVNKSWKDGSGQQQQRVTWFRVSAWRNLAEPCSQFLHKGSRVMVVGEVEQARAYVGRDGNAAASIEVTAQTVRFLDGRNQEQETPTPDRATYSREDYHAAHPEQTLAVPDENIPF